MHDYTAPIVAPTGKVRVLYSSSYTKLQVVCMCMYRSVASSGSQFRKSKVSGVTGVGDDTLFKIRVYGQFKTRECHHEMPPCR